MPPGAAPRAVRVVPAAEATVARTVSATGTLAADEQVVLGTKVVGRLAEITVDLGSLVKQGQPVARIDTKDYQYRLDQAVAALKQARVRLGLPADGDDDRVDLAQTAVVRQAKALLDQAQLNRDRMAQLWERQLVARAELDAAVSAFQVAEGRYQDALEEVQNRQGDAAAAALGAGARAPAARRHRDRSRRSTAPWSSGRRPWDEYLAAGAPVVTIVRLHPLRLRLSVPEREAASVRAGTARPRHRRGRPGVYTRARWRACRRRSPSRTGRCSSRRRSRTRAAASGPGSFAKAEIVVQADDRIVTVPATALVTFAGVEKVLTVRDGKSEEVRVHHGPPAGRPDRDRRRA